MDVYVNIHLISIHINKFKIPVFMLVVRLNKIMSTGNNLNKN